MQSDKSVALYVVNSRVEGCIAGSKWAQMPVVEKAFEGARLNPLKPLMSGLVYFVFPHFNITVKRKHGYWTFEYLFSLFLCDTQVHIHTNRY